MKKYRINVNGSLYEVEIEEIAAPATMSAPTPAPAAAPVAAAPAGGAQVKAPMPVGEDGNNVVGEYTLEIYVNGKIFALIDFTIE